MSAATKFLFDTDFGGNPEGKPAEPAITLAEHAMKLAEAETAAHRRGYAEAQNDAKVEADRRLAAALEHIAAGARRGERRAACDRNAARMRGGRGRGGGGAQARAGLDRARAVRRNRGAGERLLPSN